MIMFDVLIWLATVVAFLIVFTDIVCAIRNAKYQKIWNEEKAMYEKSTPKPTRADLCEQYVMFCLRNECMVDF